MSTYFDNKLKEKLDSYVPENATGNWDDFEKKLPKSSKPFWKNLSMLIVSSIIVSTAIVFSVSKNDEVEVQNDAGKLINSNRIDTEVLGAEEGHELVADAIIPKEKEIKDIINENDVLRNTESKHNTITENDATNKLVSPVLKNTNSASEGVSENNCLSMATEETQEQLKVINETTSEKLPIVIYSKVDKTSGCAPLAVNFSTNADPSDYDITWYFKDGAKSNNQSVTHLFKETGKYKPVLVLTSKTDNKLNQRIKCDFIEVYGFDSPKLIVEESLNVYSLSIESENSIKETTWLVNNEYQSGEYVDLEFEKDGLYPVVTTVTDFKGCKAEIKENVKVTIKHYFEMPNAFTPDGDGVNSTFGPVHEYMQDLSFNMTIFNSKNEKLFESNDIESPWDGVNMFTGEALPQGVYLYKVTTVDEFDNIRIRKGQVTLFRN